MQLELFDYRKDYLFESENQIAWYCDVLKETSDSITYAEHIVPHKGKAIFGMEYEEYIDVKKNKLRGLTYDQILKYLKSTKKEKARPPQKIWKKSAPVWMFLSIRSALLKSLAKSITVPKPS